MFSFADQLPPSITQSLSFFSASYPPLNAFDFMLIDPGREFLDTKYIVHYGLMERCERQVLRMPDPEGDWQEIFTTFKCCDFPKSVSDRCEKENRPFSHSRAIVAEIPFPCSFLSRKDKQS